MSAEAAKPKGANVRWFICALLCAGLILNYLDRLVLSVLKPTLQDVFGWREDEYGAITAMFQITYGIGFMLFGRLIDRIGAKTGYLIAMSIWTVAHIAQGLVSTTAGFLATRIGLAAGESGAYPSTMTAIAQWFPKRERALAIGIVNAGTNVGAIVTPLIVPMIALSLGWRSAFWLTGLFNIVWIAAWVIWFRRPREHPGITQKEIDYIESDPPIQQRPVPWRHLLATKQAWAYMAGRFLIDPVWWMFLFWLPDFLHKRYAIDLKNFGPPIVAVYLVADVGSIAGGWASSRFLSQGMATGRARKMAMFFCALLTIPVAFATFAPTAWLGVALIALACAGHQGFSANLFAMPSDLFPQWAQGSVIGLGGFAGAVGGMLLSTYAGWVLQTVGSYTPIFMICGVAYLLALFVFHRINPQYEPVTRFGPINESAPREHS